MMRLLSILAIVAVVMAAAYGSAASLGVEGGAIQAGADDTLWCDSDGVQANWGLEVEDNTVRMVRITGIDGACSGNVLFAKVLDASGAQLAYKYVTLDGTEATIRFDSPYLAPSAIEGLNLWIEGPAGN